MLCALNLMKKRGLFGMIILGAFALLLIAGVGSGIYFYNYYVFKEIRVCVGEGENYFLPCESQADCLAALNFSNDAIKDAPVFIREKFDSILDAAVYCESTCFAGKVRGIDYETGSIEDLANCEDGEEEFVMEIRGSEGIEILEWMKESAL
jgi:hypothetical protein